MSKKYVVGIDLGGTNARAAAVDRDLHIAARNRCSTPAADGFAAVMRSLAQLTDDMLRDAKIDKSEVGGLCVACPGPLDGDQGIVIHAPNLQWFDVPVVKTLGDLTGLKTILENDANAAGYGEFIAGAGKGAQTMIMMTLGTGVGGAVVIDGQLRRGPSWTGGELGHTVILDGGRQCACGQRGCLEAYASATSTVGRFVEARQAGSPSSLTAAAVSCREIFTAAKAGDELAKEIVAGTAHYIAVAASNLANLLNPDRLVISGGPIQAGDFLFDQIRAEYVNRPFTRPVRHMQILPATLGEDAGVVGAAGCALRLLG
ncbi:MAG: ROK family protein [Planctomycetota bacterium]|jgi:glucokinase|nr:ROK family protein [Planctomycetota bacterium]